MADRVEGHCLCSLRHRYIERCGNDDVSDRTWHRRVAGAVSLPFCGDRITMYIPPDALNRTEQEAVRVSCRVNYLDTSHVVGRVAQEGCCCWCLCCSFSSFRPQCLLPRRSFSSLRNLHTPSSPQHAGCPSKPSHPLHDVGTAEITASLSRPMRVGHAKVMEGS